jgi:hypothetical protein
MFNARASRLKLLWMDTQKEAAAAVTSKAVRPPGFHASSHIDGDK